MLVTRAVTLALLLALSPTATLGQAAFHVSFNVDRSRSDKVQIVGSVLNNSFSDVFDVNVTAEALDHGGRVVASGITYVEGRIDPGQSRPFVAVVPVAPGAVRYRVEVTSFRAGFGVQSP